VVSAGGSEKFGEESRVVRTRLDAVRLRRLDERVQVRACSGACRSLTEEPVAAALPFPCPPPSVCAGARSVRQERNDVDQL
jgi:hypothetical protein